MYRLLETIPGLLAWGTLMGLALLALYAPFAAAVFIILFDIYWLLKTIYLSLHLRSTFKRMRRNLEIDWLQKIKTEYPDQWQAIYHLVIFPMHREPYEVVRESFVAVAQSNYPLDKVILVLAGEEQTPEAPEVAQKIKQEFGSAFFKFLITRHPKDIPGELPGKGSNETYAAREAKNLIIDRLGIPYENILVSVFDIDTQVAPEYFGILTHHFFAAPRPLRSSYQPIPLFVNNIFSAPALARVIAFSASFWQMIQQSRPERLTTFSSHAMPFNALVEVGFWQTNVVSEDSRIFWQCLLHYHGDWRVVPLFYPLSMDASVALTFWGTMKNIYRQQRRWGWGAENVPYLVYGFLRSRAIPFRTKLYWIFHTTEGYHSWATNSFIIFIMGWLPILLGGTAFQVSTLSYNLPPLLRNIMNASMVGIASSAVLSILLLPPKPAWFRPRHYALYAVQWLLIPLTLIVFGALPALEAQTRLMLGGRWRLGFWATPKFRHPRQNHL
ncbi:MAG: glycosyltransferase family 2 protein [Candidatus Sungbacteria bacterium]|nr:glycosyltransferase family 2 protein [Candidatus Sungbacteria bacterium]